MFVYFFRSRVSSIETPTTLRTKLRVVQSRYGDGRFQQFYREFLLKLFHKGLGQPVDQRKPGTEGAPWGGSFPERRPVRRSRPGAGQPRHLHPRRRIREGLRLLRRLPLAPGRASLPEDNEINPDVLGYIFEKYVNQKQMGAYYTKEDITGYISRNTVIPVDVR